MRIGIIGMGHVGPHVAFNLALQGLADEILAADMDTDKCSAEVHDLKDSTPNGPYCPAIIDCGDGFERLAGCDVVVNATGNIRLSDMDRDGELGFGVNAARLIVPRLGDAGFTGIWINISNPCDVVTREILRLSGLPSSRVMGTGTMLDSARLAVRLAEALDVDPHAVDACMLGEHGNTQFAAWSHVAVHGIGLDEWERSDGRAPLDRAALESSARNGGGVVYHAKRCTEYGVANAAGRLVRAIARNEHAVLPVSVALDGLYGQEPGSGLCVSTLAVVGRQGVERVIELDLPDGELNEMRRSCERVQANWENGTRIAEAEEPKLG